MGSKPEKIQVSKSKATLRIEWNDGLVSEYPLSGLRSACPCAECRGGHENMGGDPSPEMFLAVDEDIPANHLLNLEAVGTYGITPEWQDGHHYGIYNWSYLRKLCPCPICREEAE